MGVNPLWAHFGATVLDKLEGALASALVAYGVAKSSSAAASLKKLKQGADFKKNQQSGSRPLLAKPANDSLTVTVLVAPHHGLLKNFAC